MKVQCSNCQEILSCSEDQMGMPVACPSCNGFLLVPKERFSTSTVVGDFVVKDELGRGAVGIVYRAHQISLNREAAVKILNEKACADPNFVGELVAEARLAAKLNHPNIVQCYAVGEDDGVHFFAMEYVEGKTLKNILTKKWKLAVPEAVGIVRQVAVALEHAWRELRLVHRDVKPDNIIMTMDGNAKLADLGLARPVHELDEDDEFIHGTPQYICPESVVGDPVDYRGDIYSLGCVLYQCLTGRFPFYDRDPLAIVNKHVNETCPPPTEFTPELPEALCGILERMMRKSPLERYQDYSVLVRDLDAVLEELRVGVPAPARTSILAALCPTPSRSISRTAVDGAAPTDVEYHLFWHKIAAGLLVGVAVILALYAGFNWFDGGSAAPPPQTVGGAAVISSTPTPVTAMANPANPGTSPPATPAPVANPANPGTSPPATPAADGGGGNADSASPAPGPPRVRVEEADGTTAAAWIAPADAANHVGEVKTVRGQAVSLSYVPRIKGEPTFINLDRKFPNNVFTAVIWGDTRGDYDEPPEQKFANQLLEVTGKIGLHDGKPRIVVSHPRQIRIVGEGK